MGVTTSPSTARAPSRSPTAFSGRQDAGGELPRLLEDRLGDVERHVLAAGQPGDLVERRELAQHELHVAERSVVFPHVVRVS